MRREHEYAEHHFSVLIKTTIVEATSISNLLSTTASLRYENNTMKLELLSLSSFFAIATTANGQFLRGDKKIPETMTEQDQELDNGPIATLDIDDNHLDFFDLGDAIFVLGILAKLDPLTSTTLLNEMTPVEVFERLSLKAPPAVLVNAQKRIEKLMSTPASMNDITTRPEPCETFFSLAENGYVEKHTEKIGAVAEPIRGCVAIKGERWNGSEWVHIRNEVARACVGALAFIKSWGARQTYSADVSLDATGGDKYSLEACWD
jgi:hypothetical protein